MIPKFIFVVIDFRHEPFSLCCSADHEIVNALSKISAFSYVPTSRTIAGETSVFIKDSKYESGIMPVISRKYFAFY